VVMKALALARSQRWQGAGEMAEALGARVVQPARPVAVTPPHERTVALPGARAAAPVAPAAVAVPPRRRGIPWWAWLVGSFVLLGICGGILALLLIIGAAGERAATAQATQTAQVAQATNAAQMTVAAQNAQATATVEARMTATAVSALATARAQAGATATAEAQFFDELLEASQWPVLFSDDFAVDEGGWSVGEYEGTRVLGNREIANGAYRWEAEAIDGFVWWSLPETDAVSSYYAQVSAQQVSGAMGAQYGLIIGHDDSDNYGLFKIDPSEQEFKFSIRYEGEWATVIDWTSTNLIRSSGLNWMAVIVEGDSYSFYINDQFVARVNENRLGSGKVGLAIELNNAGETAVIEFDNFSLHTP